MSTAIAIEPANSGTPRFSHVDGQVRRGLHEDATPISYSSTSPGLRGAFETFGANLDPFDSDDLVRVVLSTQHRRPMSFSNAPLDAWLSVFLIGGSDNEAAAAIASPTADAVATFTDLATELGLTQREMFAATGIKKRTFHAWRNASSDSRPRLSSLGDLWMLADTVAELRDLVNGPLAKWIAASSERRRALLERKWDDLTDDALHRPQHGLKSIGEEYHTGVGIEPDVPLVRAGTSNPKPVPRGLRR